MLFVTSVALSFVPVSAAEQRRALRTLGETVFGPDAFDFPPELIARLQPERRGFDALRRAEEHVRRAGCDRHQLLLLVLLFAHHLPV